MNQGEADVGVRNLCVASKLYFALRALILVANHALKVSSRHVNTVGTNYKIRLDKVLGVGNLFLSEVALLVEVDAL